MDKSGHFSSSDQRLWEQTAISF